MSWSLPAAGLEGALFPACKAESCWSWMVFIFQVSGEVCLIPALQLAAKLLPSSWHHYGVWQEKQVDSTGTSSGTWRLLPGNQGPWGFPGGAGQGQQPGLSRHPSQGAGQLWSRKAAPAQGRSFQRTGELWPPPPCRASGSLFPWHWGSRAALWGRPEAKSPREGQCLQALTLSTRGVKPMVPTFALNTRNSGIPVLSSVIL